MENIVKNSELESQQVYEDIQQPEILDEDMICECGNEKGWDNEKCQECEDKEREQKEEPREMKEKKQKTELVEAPQAQKPLSVKTTGLSPAEMISQAVQGGADLEKLEKLLTLQERWEANEARKVFASCFASAQERISSVVKLKENPQTHSKYATLEDIIESAKPVYTKEGFSVIFYEGETPITEHIRIYADVLHKAGHKETFHYDVPLDGVGLKGNANMTKIHAKASSTSYGRRYLMCMIWNVPTLDNDAKGLGVEYIDDKQLHRIRAFILSLGANEEKFLGFLEVEKLEVLPKKDYQKAIAALEATKKKREMKK